MVGGKVVTGWLTVALDTLGPQDLSAVRKNAKTGQIEVGSVAYMVHKVVGVGDGGYNLYQRQSPYNKTFVVVDPLRKTVVLAHHSFQPFW